MISGVETVVDPEDYLFLSGFRWRSLPAGYVVTRIGGKLIYLHRLLMNPRRKQVVDHINNNPLDNRKSNLRVCSQGQNLYNSVSKNSNGKGVTWHIPSRAWRATIGFKKKQIHLGVFSLKSEAQAAYRIAALRLAGPYAKF